MTRCIHCSLPVKSLVRVEQGVPVLERCPRCEGQCDPYVEHDAVQVCLDIFLLHGDAWSHVIFNLGKNGWRYLIPLVMAVVVAETYVATTIRLYSELLYSGGSVADGQLVALSPTLKLVDNLGPNRIELYHMQLGSFVECCLYGILEYVFVTVSLMWAGSWLTIEADPGRGALRTWFTTTAVVWSVKALFAVFFLWNVPLYLVVIVDMLSVLWLLRGVNTVAPRATATSALVVCCIAIGSRFAFRGITRWCPLFVTADLLMAVIGE